MRCCLGLIVVLDACYCVVFALHDMCRHDITSYFWYVITQLHSLVVESILGYSLFYYFMLWFALLSVALIFMLLHGIDYVAWPRLIPPTDIIYYSGPGYRSGQNGKGLGGKLMPGMEKSRWLTRRVKVEEAELGTVKKRVD
jgi:hypothetical protein